MSPSQRPSHSPDDLVHLFGDVLPRAIGDLDERTLLGPWPGGLDARPSTRPFDPPLYDANHAHPHPEICHLLRGRCRLSFEQNAHILSTGDLVCLPPSRAHAESYFRRSTGYRLAWWILPPAAPVIQVTDYDPSFGFRVINRVSLSDQPAEVRDRVDWLAAAVRTTKAVEPLALKEALLTLVLTTLRRIANPNASVELDQRPATVERAIRFIADNLDRPIDLAEVGREVVLSPNYLTTLFRQHTGISLGGYIKKKRIERAKVLLVSSAVRIKDVADAVGFSDPFAFSRSFRSEVGCSPSQFRSRIPANRNSG